MLALWSWKKIHTTSVEIDLGTVSYFSFFILLVFFLFLCFHTDIRDYSLGRNRQKGLSEFKSRDNILITKSLVLNFFFSLTFGPSLTCSVKSVSCSERGKLIKQVFLGTGIRGLDFTSGQQLTALLRATSLNAPSFCRVLEPQGALVESDTEVRSRLRRLNELVAVVA